MNTLKIYIIAISSLLMSISAYADRNEEPEISFERMELILQNEFSTVYRKSNVDLKQYNQLILEPGKVNFNKNWREGFNRNQRRLGNRAVDDDINRIKREVASIFDEVLSEEFEKLNNFSLVSESSKNTLLLKPSIRNLDVYLPELDKAYLSQNYVERAGEGKLYLEMFDSTSNEILFVLIDDKQARYYDFYGWTDTANSITRNKVDVISKRVDARIALRDWIRSVSETLDEINI